MIYLLQGNINSRNENRKEFNRTDFKKYSRSTLSPKISNSCILLSSPRNIAGRKLYIANHGKKTTPIGKTMPTHASQNRQIQQSFKLYYNWILK